jgi:hypothetical protein
MGVGTMYVLCDGDEVSTSTRVCSGWFVSGLWVDEVRVSTRICSCLVVGIHRGQASLHPSAHAATLRFN